MAADERATPLRHERWTTPVDSRCRESFRGSRAVCRLPLRAPSNAKVRELMTFVGPTVTPLDIALDILCRLSQEPQNDSDEVEFLRDCLEANRGVISEPFHFSFTGTNSETVIKNALLDTYSRSAERRHLVLPWKRDTWDEMMFKPPERIEEAAWPCDGVNREGLGELRKLIDADFSSWGFDTFAVSRLTNGRPLQVVGWEVFQRRSIVSDFSLHKETMERFLLQVETAYLSEETTAYHTKVHAADVAQSVHALLRLGFEKYFDSMSIFAILLGAIVHDMGHDGRGNSFHVNTRDDLALTYNDASVLENFHIASAFKLLFREVGVNVLGHMPLEKQHRMRKEMINCVLGTDMAHHFSHVGVFKNLVNNLGSEPEDWHGDRSSISEMLSILLHNADISNVAKSEGLMIQWVDRLFSEFFSQGDEEKRLGVPVSPLCDRDTVQLGSSQVGFIRFIVQPSFELLTDLVPAIKDCCMNELEKSTVYWETRKSEETVTSNSVKKPGGRGPESEKEKPIRERKPEVFGKEAASSLKASGGDKSELSIDEGSTFLADV
eukprot:TRINITY_DN10273_c0_g1_i2.p1 TRINITY_DN10273_c0_g1~~TRINITY_DN10273_c0_g1_i2.p1  ORF type:complete len:572 (+),score=72.51 TRINITY_DN10273_c0_g1_i2:64-1716(+)